MTAVPVSSSPGVGGFAFTLPMLRCDTCNTPKAMTRRTDSGAVTCPACDPAWAHAQPKAPVEDTRLRDIAITRAAERRERRQAGRR